MKKVMASLICLCLVISFAGCSQDKYTEESTKAATEATEVAEKENINETYVYAGNPVGYDYIVALYDRMYREEWDWEKTAAFGLSSMLAYHYDDDLSYSYRADLQAGYSYVDLDNDGLNELIIGAFSREENTVEIYELYTYKDGKAQNIIEAGESGLHYLCEDNGEYKIAIEWYEFDYRGFSYCALQNGELKEERGVSVDYVPDEEGNVDIYAVLEINGQEKEIDEEAANEIMAGYKEKYVLPGFIPFGDEGRAPVTNEDVYVRFLDAEDFWNSWVYGATYRAYDNPSQFAFGSSRESITSDSPIQTSYELRAEMEKHFTMEMADMYWKQLVPEDKDGKLYVYTGDVGGPYSGAKKITVEKINDERYRLNLDIWSYMEDEEPDLPDKCVYYVSENGRWVFENDVEDEFFLSREEPERYNSNEFAPYNEILKAYYAALWQKWDIDRLNKNELPYMLMYSNSKERAQRMQAIGYCLMDVNGDNQDELLVGEIAPPLSGQVIYAMYTVKDGSVYQMFESGERQRHTLYEENGKYYIAYEGSNSAVVNHFLYSEIVGHKLVTEKIIIQDAFEYPDNPWYEQEPQDETINPISEKEAMKIIESYRAKYITPEFIPFETLG